MGEFFKLTNIKFTDKLKCVYINKSTLEYAKKANDLFKNKSNYQVKVDDNGITRVYDSVTNSFGSYNPNGTTKTFFKPTGGQSYFNSQPGWR